ncbi:MAG: lipid A phosphate methyltransferase [Clostridia bacterium]|nr:lipid A phosphate methyltransferase [Clostridia bacterium]
MALIHSFESSGNYLFRNRSWLPVFLFVPAAAVVWFTNITWLNGFWYQMVTALALLASIAGFVVRAIAIGTTPAGTSGRNTSEGQVAEQLNTGGIYSTIRHPLYLGNYLMWIGIVIFTFNIYFVIIVSLAFWLYYERIMFAEERFLERKFGDAYLEWSCTAPAFIPSFKNYRKSPMGFSFKTILRREYSGVLATVIGFAFIDNLRWYFLTHTFDPLRTVNIILIITILIVLILRTLKHNTRLLQEQGRS